jgi:signal transduction histidine kinase
LAIYAYSKEKKTEFIKVFAASMVAAGFWPLMYGLELIFTDLNTIKFLSLLKPVSIQLFTPLWFSFAYLLVKQEMPPKRIMIFLYSMGILSIIILLTNNFHHLYWAETVVIDPEKTGGLVILGNVPGWFLLNINMPYHYITTMAIFYLLIKGAITHKSPYRMQFILVFTATLIIILASVVYILQIPPFTLISPAPAVFFITGTMVGVAVFRFGLLDLIPYARERAFELIQSPIVIVDFKERILDFNRSALDIYADIKVNMSLHKLLEELGISWIELEKYSSALAEVKRGTETFFYSVVKKEIKPHESTYILLFSDVTAHTKLLQSEHAKEIVKYKESILGDMHDGIGGVLATTAIISQAAIQTENIEEKDEYLKKMSTLLENGSFELRSMLNILDKEEIDLITLISDMRAFSSTVLEARDIKLRFKQKVDTELYDIDFEKYLSIFRIFKEAVTNVVKHSDADNVEIRISLDTFLKIELIDNGKGLPDKLKKGFGLDNMRKRSENLGGSFTISNDKGTTITVDIPLEK